MNISKTIDSYLDELSSSSPTPGGGNVSAFCGALASSLGEMVCNLTIGKKKYADVEQEISSLKAGLVASKDRFLQLAAEDNSAFDQVMEAFRLPKTTPEEISARDEQIEAATRMAAKVPSEVVTLCAEVIPAVKTVAEKGNRNSLSDAGVAALLLSAASQGAYLNVLINCSSLKDRSYAEELLRETEEKLLGVKSLSESINNDIISGLK